MTTSTTSVSGTVVVGVDGSPSSEHAVVWAAEEAHLRHQRLVLARARTKVSANELALLSQAGVHPRVVNEQIGVEAERIVERARSLAADRFPSVPIEIVMGDGDARKQLLDLATGASMVVVGTRGHGPVMRLLLGSVSAALVRHSDVPIAVVRPGRTGSRGVLIAADGSEDSLAPVEYAFREASQRKLPLTIAHCLWDGLLAQAR